MDKLIDVKGTLSAICGAVAGFLGWFGMLLAGWIVCMTLDYVTGTLAACKQGEWSSQLAREGIWHKLGAIVTVTASGCMDLLIMHVVTRLPIDFHYPGVVCPIVMTWYIVTELGSILENGIRMGASIPSWLTRLFAVTKEAIDRDGENKVSDFNDHGEVET